MKYELVLQIASTGQTLKAEVVPTYKGSGTPMTAAQFKRYWVTRYSRYKRTSDDIRRAIEEDDLIVGWSNYDDLRRAGMPRTKVLEVLDFLRL